MIGEVALDQRLAASLEQRYQRKYASARRLFQLLDCGVSLITRFPYRRPLDVPTSPQRILVACAGHIGDYVLLTASLQGLRRRFPHAKIVLLATPYAQPVFAATCFVDELVMLDHWFLERSHSRRIVKVLRYFFRAVTVALFLRRRGFEIALDVRAWFPNSAAVLWLAGIPVRAGFSGLNLKSLLTHPLPAEFGRGHEVEEHWRLLSHVFHDIGTLAPALPRPVVTPAGIAEADEVLHGVTRPFRVLHMGTSSVVKEWPENQWRALTMALLRDRIVPVFTGRGMREREMVARVTTGLQGCVDTCDRLGWEGLVALVSRAQLVYCPDTSVGHVAAALGRPVIALMGGMGDIWRWRPYGSSVRIVSHRPACFPCLNKAGCMTLQCIRSIELDDVQQAASVLLALSGSQCEPSGSGERLPSKAE